MAFYFFYFIKMGIATDDGQVMLPRQGSDPQIIVRNGRSGCAQFLANGGVVLGCVAVDGKDFEFLHSLSQPILVGLVRKPN